MNMSTDNTEKIIQQIRKFTKSIPELALVLGTGLSDFADTLLKKNRIPTSSIEGYPQSTIEGHPGQIIFSQIKDKAGIEKDVLIFQGRVHFYESGNFEKTTLPIIIAHALGVKRLVLTCAVGGINPLFSPGDLMLIHDYIKFTSEKSNSKYPLNILKTNELYKSTCSEFLCNKVTEVASEMKIPLRHGNYCWVTGPSYETSAEVKMIHRMGGDVVGMSTFPEAIIASGWGIECVGISCITNMATGLSPKKLTHQEVIETAGTVKNRFSQIMISLLHELA